MRFLNKPLISILTAHLIDYPTPINLSYMWGFGSAAGIFLVVQLITGIALAMHYVPHVDLAFLSVEHIMRDVNNGWLLRYLHANGASFFFLVVYLHLFRGLYYGSYQSPRALTWCLGVGIFILMMATAFIGYVLPWGQMSFWGATVITNLFSAIPIVGESLVIWIWGGFCVDNATLNRFFSLHYLLPFAIVALVLAHIIMLHKKGSSNPIGIYTKVDKVSFYRFFIPKDIFGWIILFAIYSFFVFKYPNYLGHSDNYIEANPMVTPAHIVPEWYFLPFYAILRSIPDKLFGVLAMFGALVILFFIPFLNLSPIRSSVFRPIHQFFFWLLFMDYLILGWIGGCIPETPYYEIGQAATIFYFVYFLLLLPILGIIEYHMLTCDNPSYKTI